MKEEEKNKQQLSKVEQLYDDDKLLEAGRILKELNPSTLTTKHKTILQKAKKGEELIEELTSDLHNKENPWIIHGVSKGEFPTLSAHRLEKCHGDDNNKNNNDGNNGNHHVELKARCETPIDKSLLSPLISVLNETELYETWLPSWNVPKFRIKKCQKLSQRGRCSQVIIITFDVPWPIATREVVLLADGIDDINHNGDIAIRLHSVDTGDEDGLVPPPEDKSIVRMDIDGGFIFRQCPKDHPALVAGDADEKILVTFAASVNPKMKLLPQSFLNFLVKTAFKIGWIIMLKVARDVRDGKREDHKNKIKEKRGILYDWVDERLREMMLFGQAMTNATM